MKLKVSMACCVLLGAMMLAGCGKTVSEGAHGLQADGSYNLDPRERAVDCSAVHQEMRRLANETVAHDVQASKEVASTVVWGVLFGAVGVASYRKANNAGEASKQAERNRAKLAAYDDNLSARGCSTWDYEAHMRNKYAAINARHAEQRRKNKVSVR